MRQFNRSLSVMPTLIAATAIFACTASAATAQAKPSAAAATAVPSIPVNVTNPVITVQGNVNASVNGTVGVSSLPAVQLAGTPAVQLSNTPTTPVYVDSDRAARNGFNASCTTPNIDSVSGQASCSLFAIPAGRQVVIETISCQAELFAGEGPGDVQLVVPNAPPAAGAPDHVSHFLTLTKQAGDATLAIWRITTPLRAYGSAPTQGSVDISLFFRANPASPNPQGIGCTISGFLVAQ